MNFDTSRLMGDIANASQENLDEFMMFSRKQWEHELNHSRQNMEERKLYASGIFQFTCLWCIMLFVILIGCGLGRLELSDVVVTTLIGSTTLNVFIFFKLVTEYLFNKENPHS